MREVELEDVDAELRRPLRRGDGSSRTAAMPCSSSSRGTAPNGPWGIADADTSSHPSDKGTSTPNERGRHAPPAWPSWRRTRPCDRLPFLDRRRLRRDPALGGDGDETAEHEPGAGMRGVRPDDRAVSQRQSA